MKINGSAIYVCPVCNILNCYVIEIFFSHQFNNSFFQGFLRFKNSPIHFSHRIPTNMAKKWLKESDMKIVEIAERLQYNNSANFIRSFRKMVDMTPGQYREEG